MWLKIILIISVEGDTALKIGIFQSCKPFWVKPANHDFTLYVLILFCTSAWWFEMSHCQQFIYPFLIVPQSHIIPWHLLFLQHLGGLVHLGDQEDPDDPFHQLVQSHQWDPKHKSTTLVTWSYLMSCRVWEEVERSRFSISSCFVTKHYCHWLVYIPHLPSRQGWLTKYLCPIK